jgi:MFS transporter, NNP family, nitrate/nitrite transporter
LPILFGALVDLTGVRSSCFMLMYGVVWVSLTWMYFSEIRKSAVLGKTPLLTPSPISSIALGEEHVRSAKA